MSSLPLSLILPFARPHFKGLVTVTFLNQSTVPALKGPRNFLEFMRRQVSASKDWLLLGHP